MFDLDQLHRAVVAGDAKTARAIADASLAEGIEPLRLVNDRLVPAMKTTIDAFQRAGLRGKVKILVGGAAVTRRFAEEIAADGHSDNAVGAVALAKRVLGVLPRSAEGDPFAQKAELCIL